MAIISNSLVEGLHYSFGPQSSVLTRVGFLLDSPDSRLRPENPGEVLLGLPLESRESGSGTPLRGPNGEGIRWAPAEEFRRTGDGRAADGGRPREREMGPH